MINLSDVATAMNQAELERIIREKHPYPITQGKGKDKRFKTYIKTESGKRKQIAKTSLSELKEVLYEHYQGAIAKPKTLEDIFPEFMEYKELLGAKPTYLHKMRYHWEKYYVGSEIIKTPICNLKKLDCVKWAHESVRKWELTSKEYNNMSVIFRQALDYAVDLELIENNVFRKVKIQSKLFKKVSKKDDLEQVFTRQELHALTEAAWNEVNNHSSRKKHKLVPLAMLFQIQTGLRVSELAALKHGDVDYSRKELRVQRMYRFPDKEIDEYTKGAFGDRKVILTDAALEILTEVDRIKAKLGVSTEYIFSVVDLPPGYDVFRECYVTCCDKAKINHKSTHTARRTFVSMLLSSNVNLDSVRRTCGHVDSRTTLNNYYYDVHTDEEKRQQFGMALTW